jgi:exopolyphosphatase/pppGpp-phosphohydrolase
LTAFASSFTLFERFEPIVFLSAVSNPISLDRVGISWFDQKERYVVSTVQPDSIVELLKWTAERRDQAYSDLANRVAAEKTSQEAVSQAEQKLKEIESERATAQANLTRLGDAADQGTRDRVTNLIQNANTTGLALSQARIAANQATADRKAAEAIHKSRVDSYQDLLNTIKPRFAATLSKGITWAFSGDRWPQGGVLWC